MFVHPLVNESSELVFGTQIGNFPRVTVRYIYVSDIPRPSSKLLSPASRRRAPGRLRQLEPRIQLVVRGVLKGALRTHSA